MAHIFALNPVTRVPEYGVSIDIGHRANWPAFVSVPDDFNPTWLNNFRPVNVRISPNGQTAIVPCAVLDQAAILRIWGPGVVTLQSIIAPGGWPRDLQENPHLSWNPTCGAQSVVFSPDGKHAYIFQEPNFALLPWGGKTYLFQSEVVVLNVTGPGRVSPAGIHIEVTPTRCTSQLFGVDTMAVEPTGKYLFVTNPTLSAYDSDCYKSNSQAVIDLTLNKQIGSLYSDGCDEPEHPPCYPNIPIGIAFWRGRHSNQRSSREWAVPLDCRFL